MGKAAGETVMQVSGQYQVAVTRVIAVLGQSKKNSIENKGGSSLVLSYFDHVHFIMGGSSFTFDVKGGG